MRGVEWTLLAISHLVVILKGSDGGKQRDEPTLLPLTESSLNSSPIHPGDYFSLDVGRLVGVYDSSAELALDLLASPVTKLLRRRGRLLSANVREGVEDIVVKKKGGGLARVKLSLIVCFTLLHNCI